MLDKKTHKHTLERSAINPKVYRCVHPECKYFARADFIVGNIALCYKCNAEYVVQRYQLFRDKLKRPTCLKCSNSKVAQQVRVVANELESILETTSDEEKVEIKL